MDYTYGVPIPQSFVDPGYAQYQHYPQAFTGYEQYFTSYPWAAGSYAPMYPYNNMTGGYQQMSYYPTKEEVCEPPVSKKARIEVREEIPNLRDVDAHLLEVSNGNEISLTEGCPSPDIDVTLDKSLPLDGSVAMGPMMPTLANPLPPLTIDSDTFVTSPGIPTPPLSPIQQTNTSTLSMNGSYSNTPGPRRRRRGTRAGEARAKNNICPLCEKSYDSSYKLKLHMHAHTGERPFVYDFCGKGFARGPNLNAHRRIHTGEKPFSCKRCGRGFSHPSDRIVHMVTEVCIRSERYIRRTGQGWECVSCESGSFESRDMAERHTRQHETGKGLSCPVCRINYQGQKANVLVKHVRDCHPEYIDNLY